MRSYNSNKLCEVTRTATASASPSADFIAAATVLLLWTSACSTAAPDTTRTHENELSREYKMDAPIERWQLERNPIAAPLVSARKIEPSYERVPGIPPCGFSRPVFWNSGHEVVADQDVFTDLRTVGARQARGLGPEGTLVGRLHFPKHNPRQVVQLLVTSGIVDANIHVVATVSLVEEGKDSQGYWARLISDDRFWTNQENRVLYDFAIRISPDGEIRLINASDPVPIGDGTSCS